MTDPRPTTWSTWTRSDTIPASGERTGNGRSMAVSSRRPCASPKRTSASAETPAHALAHLAPQRHDPRLWRANRQRTQYGGEFAPSLCVAEAYQRQRRIAADQHLGIVEQEEQRPVQNVGLVVLAHGPGGQSADLHRRAMRCLDDSGIPHAGGGVGSRHLLSQESKGVLDLARMLLVAQVLPHFRLAQPAPKPRLAPGEIRHDHACYRDGHENQPRT